MNYIFYRYSIELYDYPIQEIMKNRDKASAPVSVIVPCYRSANTVTRAVDSILAQSISPAEIILVDDCSDDETPFVLQSLANAHAGLISVVQMKSNTGAGSARNIGWALASQPYIAFLDSDDTWHPEKLRIQYEYMQTHPDVLLCGHQCFFLNEPSLDKPIPEHLKVTSINPASLLFKNPFSTPTIMLKSAVPYRFQEGQRYAEDILLWQQLAFAGFKLVRIEGPLAYVHKPLYGVGGLSAQLWKMEQGELTNLISLYKGNTISLAILILAILVSIAKFIKRLSIKKLRRLTSFLTKGSNL